MSYSEAVARTVADQLARFVTLNRHQLAGHAANLDFWVGEARHALAVLDGYQERFRRLRSGQADYVAANQVTAPSPCDADIRAKPDPPRRVPDADVREARRAVADALYHFLVRLYRDGLIDESRLRGICGELGVGIEAADLRRGR